MAAGPQRARLDRALSGAAADAIEARAKEWENCRDILERISFSLANASPQVKERIGGKTGPAVDAAFHRSAQHMGDKAAQLVEGAQALRNAAQVIHSAKLAQQDLAAHPLTEPPTYTRPVGQPTRADLREEAQSRQAHQEYQAAYADQEARAKAHADAMDRVFGHSTATMKKIHGEPDPEPTGAGGSGGGGGGSRGGAPGGPAVSPYSGGGTRPTGSGPTYHPNSPQHHGGSADPGPYVPGHPGSGPGTLGGPVGAPQGGTPIEAPGVAPGGLVGAPGASAPTGVGAGTGLGVAGVTAGGAAGGLLGAGLTTGGIRGITPVLSSPGTAAGAVRGIGTTARTGVTGTLGRPGGVGAVGSNQGTGARGTSAGARGGAGRGGSRGAAGGRTGTGATASGRGGRGKDEKGRKRDPFDTGDEWLDEDEAAPGVLD